LNGWAAEFKWPKVAKEPKVVKEPKVPGAKRGKTGYNLYMSDVKARVIADLRSHLSAGQKTAPGAVMSEIGKRWKSLPDSSRRLWNDMASENK